MRDTVSYCTRLVLLPHCLQTAPATCQGTAARGNLVHAVRTDASIECAQEGDVLQQDAVWLEWERSAE